MPAGMGAACIVQHPHPTHPPPTCCLTDEFTCFYFLYLFKIFGLSLVHDSCAYRRVSVPGHCLVEHLLSAERRTLAKEGEREAERTSDEGQQDNRRRRCSNIATPSVPSRHGWRRLAVVPVDPHVYTPTLSALHVLPM